jgi:hypothetical protein
MRAGQIAEYRGNRSKEWIVLIRPVKIFASTTLIITKYAGKGTSFLNFRGLDREVMVGEKWTSLQPPTYCGGNYIRKATDHKMVSDRMFDVKNS